MQQQAEQEAAEKPNMPSYGTVVRCSMAPLVCLLSLTSANKCCPGNGLLTIPTGIEIAIICNLARCLECWDIPVQRNNRVAKGAEQAGAQGQAPGSQGQGGHRC